MHFRKMKTQFNIECSRWLTSIVIFIAGASPVETRFVHAIVRNAFGRQSGKLNEAIVNVNNLLTILMNHPGARAPSPRPLLAQINYRIRLVCATTARPPDHGQFTISQICIVHQPQLTFQFWTVEKTKLAKHSKALNHFFVTLN